MPLTTAGAGLKLVNNGTGKLTFAFDGTGNPAFDDSQVETVFSLLMELPGWWADTLKKRRSLIPSLKSVSGDMSMKIEAYARDALQPGIDDGRLRSVTPTATPSGPGYLLRVAYVTGTGAEPPPLEVPLSV